MPVDVDLIMETEPCPDERERLVALAWSAVCQVLKMEGKDERLCEVSVVFCGDSFISELNSEYRGVEGPTDVLSFALNEGEDGPGFQNVQGMPDMLGDIVVSVETAERQAKGTGKALEDELRLLLVHGTLHLLGYDHDTPEKEAVMWKRQGEALDALREMNRF